jgi:hypothetical protein
MDIFIAICQGVFKVGKTFARKGESWWHVAYYRGMKSGAGQRRAFPRHCGMDRLEKSCMTLKLIQKKSISVYLPVNKLLPVHYASSS